MEEYRYYCPVCGWRSHTAKGFKHMCKYGMVYAGEGDYTKATKHQVGGSHYKDMPIQPAEFITKNNIPYLEGCAIKYIVRHQEKNGEEDIDKAIHVLQLIKEIRYGRTNT